MSPDELKALRKELACTAKELAIALGLEQATVLGWERGETFPTKQWIDAMNALRARGPAAIAHKSKGAAPSPMKVLADPTMWMLVRKLTAHKKFRDEVISLAASYEDPADE